MGFGNGVVFQVVSDRFPKQIGLASGLIGAAGGLGGFLLPVWLGILKDATGTFQPGLWLFAVLAAGAAASVTRVIRRSRTAAQP
jgi:NNP family nitrate/nitrite transporter-like MFS transporter